MTLASTEQPLVSVIVPVYNVEAFLHACLRSITNQDYANLEIILINDGSTDESGKICDLFAISDPRVRVIHQDNQGLSAARNRGLDNAKGTYIAFVDSDDLIRKDYISVMLRESIKEDCDLVISDIEKFEGGYTLDIHHRYEPEKIKKTAAIQRLLCGEWVSAYAKLYKYTAIRNIRFPFDRNNEDYAFLPLVLENCTSILYLPIKLYFYRMRDGSITHSKLNPHSFDEIYNDLEVIDFINKTHPNLKIYAEANLAYSLEKLYRALCFTHALSFQKERILINNLYRKGAKVFLRNPAIRLKSKFFIFFHAYFPSLASSVFKFHQRIKNSFGN